MPQQSQVLPEGVTFDSTPSGAPPVNPTPAKSSVVPAGVTFAEGVPAEVTSFDSVPAFAPREHLQGEDASGIMGLGVGVAKGAAQTVQGGEKLLNKILPANHQIPIINEESTKAANASQTVGKGAEDVMEFMAGDEALSGLAKAHRLVEAADKYPSIARVLKLARGNSVIAKMITEGSKGAIVGGVQGGLKGAAEGHAAAGAERGAVGGGIGGAVAELASPIAKVVAEKLGIGTSAAEDAAKGIRPAKRNVRFAADFQTAAPFLDAENKLNPAKTVEDWADHATTARQRLYDEKINPLIQRHATEPLGGKNIADQIRAQIPNAMKIHSPEEAAKMEQLANQFMPGQVFNLQMKDAEEALQHYNAKLTATGFYSKMPSERAALEKTDGNIAGLKAAGDAIRDEMYGKLNRLEPGSDIRGLKQQYGALRNVGDEIRGRVNVNNRQSPISLKETIGLIAGLGHGGPVGAAMAATPYLDRVMNSPEKLIGRSVQKAARPGEEGIARKVASAAGRAAPTASAIVGAQIGRLVFTASDGSIHSIPNDENSLAAARAIDPELQVHPTLE
jgi:hypothetical protein